MLLISEEREKHTARNISQLPSARTDWERPRDLFVHRPRLSGLLGCPDTSRPGRQHRTGQVSAVVRSLTGPLEAMQPRPRLSYRSLGKARSEGTSEEARGPGRTPRGEAGGSSPSVPTASRDQGQFHRALEPQKMRLFIPNFCLILELSGSLAGRPHVDMGCSQGSVSATPQQS